MANITAKYEVLMVFNVNSGEEGVKALGDKFKALISENGTIDIVEDWGKRRLAYPIEDEIEGYYLLVRFTSAPDFPAELDRVAGINDGVLRTMIVRADELPDRPEPKAAAPAPVAAPAPAAATAPVAEEKPAEAAAEIVEETTEAAVEEATPAEEPAPVEETAPAEESAPAEEE